MSDETDVTGASVLDPAIAEIQGAILMGIGVALGFLAADKLALAIAKIKI